MLHTQDTEYILDTIITYINKRHETISRLNSYRQIPNIQKGRKATDFGKGFYTTTNFEQAKKWAILKRNQEHGKKRSFQFMKSPIIFLIEFSVLRFDGATKEWLEFVVNNRRGKGKNSYDLIMGPVANDQLYATIRLYEQGVVTADAAIEMLKTLAF